MFEKPTQDKSIQELRGVGNLYIPASVRKEVGLEKGDKVQLLVNKEEKSVLIKKLSDFEEESS